MSLVTIAREVMAYQDIVNNARVPRQQLRLFGTNNREEACTILTLYGFSSVTWMGNQYLGNTTMTCYSQPQVERQQNFLRIMVNWRNLVSKGVLGKQRHDRRRIRAGHQPTRDFPRCRSATTLPFHMTARARRTDDPRGFQAPAEASSDCHKMGRLRRCSLLCRSPGLVVLGEKLVNVSARCNKSSYKTTLLDSSNSWKMGAVFGAIFFHFLCVFTFYSVGIRDKFRTFFATLGVILGPIRKRLSTLEEEQDMRLVQFIDQRDGTILSHVLELFPENVQQSMIEKLEEKFAKGSKQWAERDLPCLVGPSVPPPCSLAFRKNLARGDGSPCAETFQTGARYLGKRKKTFYGETGRMTPLQRSKLVWRLRRLQNCDPSGEFDPSGSGKEQIMRDYARQINEDHAERIKNGTAVANNDPITDEEVTDFLREHGILKLRVRSSIITLPPGSPGRWPE